MDNITERINNSLSGLWNTEDPIYRALISNILGVIPSTITKPSDLPIGAIAAMIEYLRLLSISFEKQMVMDQSSGDFLDYFLITFFKSLRLDGEDDVTWIERTKKNIFQPKVSRAALIKAMRAYSPGGEPSIISGALASMFSDCSFADRSKLDVQTVDGMPFHVFPAYADSVENSYFSIVVILYNTSVTDLATVSDILSKSIAAGIHYTIEVRTV